MARGRIVVVDDERDNLDFLTAILEDAGCEVETFSDGAEALKSMEANPPAMALLDVQMPKMNGFQILQGIRSSDKLSQLPVVFLSAIGAVTGEEYTPDTIEAKYGIRPDAFLAKPINPDEVLAQLKQVLD